MDGRRIDNNENIPEFLEENSVIESVIEADNLLTEEESKEEAKDEGSFYMISEEERNEAMQEGNVSSDEDLIDKVKIGAVSVVKCLQKGVNKVYKKLDSSESR